MSFFANTEKFAETETEVTSGIFTSAVSEGLMRNDSEKTGII